MITFQMLDSGTQKFVSNVRKYFNRNGSLSCKNSWSMKDFLWEYLSIASSSKEICTLGHIVELVVSLLLLKYEISYRVHRKTTICPAWYRTDAISIKCLVICIRWYSAYPFSYRHLEEMMHEGGVFVGHSSISHWANKFLLLLEKYFANINVKWAAVGRWIRAN